MTVQFNQVDPRGLYASSASGDAGVPGYWAGFWAPAAAGLGTTASVSATWNAVGGTYLFVATTPTSFSAFYDALTVWFPVINPVGQPRFVWLENPEDPWPYWRVTAWYAAAGGTPSARTWTTFGISTIRLGAYAMEIATGAALTLTDGTIPLVSVPSGASRFYALSGGFAPTGSPTIAFASSTIGTLAAAIPVSGQDLGALGVELRYAIRHSVKPNDPRISQIAMPVIGALDTSATLGLTWDPLNPLVRGRTDLRFASAATMAAGFVTQRGYATKLSSIAVAPPLWQAGFMFTRCATYIAAQSPGSDSYIYSLAPDGAYSIAVEPPNGVAGSGLIDELMLGLSGLETAQLSTATTLVLFTSGQNAFAPTVALDGTLPDGGNLGVPGTRVPLLNDLATSAYVSVLPASTTEQGLLYYAQPRQSPLFTGATGAGAMPFQQVPTARLGALPTTNGALPPSFPVGVYAGLPSNQSTAARALEVSALAPLRRSIIVAAPHLSEMASVDVTAISPKGLVVSVDPANESIDKVIIASLPGTSTPSLSLSAPGPDFVSAIFANQVFFVVSNPTVLTNEVTCDPPFALNLDGWEFQLDPANWRSGNAPTLMLWKYADRSLEDLAADPAAWGWPAAAADNNGSLTATWAVLNGIILAAKAADPATPYAAFYTDIVANAGWNGVLFLNAPVGINTLPDSLKFLAAGIDEAKFFAHHVGVSQTPFDPQAPITLKQSDVFGLIDYNDPIDLVPEANKPFDFKTMQLTAQFDNAHLSLFACKVELSMNQLFGSSLSKLNAVNGNNLVIIGSLQTSGGTPSYAFALTGENRYTALYAALSTVEITALRILTQSNPGTIISTNFVLGGKLQFVQVDGFDLFSYGTAPASTEGGVPFDGFLLFNQLTLTLSFPTDAPTSQTWTADETGINFDIANSKARLDSLANCFPVKAQALVASHDLSPAAETPTGLTPEDMGFTSISAPLSQVPMIPTWYGIIQSLDLGSLGALVGGVGLTAQLLTAWSAGAANSQVAVYLGLKFAGTTGINGSLPLQGILKLGFKSFIFTTYEQSGQLAYLLRMNRFGLSVLGFHFPPGNLDICIFGGPDGRSTGQPGWLAAYLSPEAAKTQALAVTPKAAITGDGVAPEPTIAPHRSTRQNRAKRLGRIPPRS